MTYHANAAHRTSEGFRPAIQVVSAGEWELLLDAARHMRGKNAVRAVAMLQLMRRCGLRRGEVVQLRAEGVHLDPLYPRVDIRDTKFGKNRNVPIDPRSLPDLRRWVAERPDSEWFFCTLSVRTGIAGGKPVGSPITNGYVWDMVQLACKKAGTRKIRPHWLRHTAATSWLREGLSLEEVRVLLGHENLHTTQRYLHVDHVEVSRKFAGFDTDNPPVRDAVSVSKRLPGVAPSPMPHEIPVSVQGLTACHWCAEPIRPEAIMCRWCRSPVAVVA